MVNHKLTNVATGTALQDAVNKGQMDAALAGAGISNIQIGAPASPANGDIWIEEP